LRAEEDPTRILGMQCYVFHQDMAVRTYSCLQYLFPGILFHGQIETADRAAKVKKEGIALDNN